MKEGGVPPNSRGDNRLIVTCPLLILNHQVITMPSSALNSNSDNSIHISLGVGVM